MVTLVLRRPVRTWWPVLLAVTLVLLAGGVVVATAPVAVAAQDPAACSNSIGLIDGGFEEPVIPADTYAFIQQGQVPGWSTTATDSNIEIWHNNVFEVTPAVGDQLAELNATQPSTLYQDLPTIPGTTMRWSLAHRGRAGADTMAVNIGPADGTLVEQQQMTDDTTRWGRYSGLYTVPDGQTTTRFAFAAVSTASSNLSVGNLLDDIVFGTRACVVATSSISSATGGPFGQGGDVLTLSVDANSGGGNPASAATLRTTLPSGVTFVPGSLRVTTNGVTTSPSLRTDEDVAEYDLSTRELVVRLGDDATGSTGGSLDYGARTTVTYQVRVSSTREPLTFASTSTVTYFDPLSNSTKVATSNTSSVTLNPIADLAVTLQRTSAAPVVAGTAVTYSATVYNYGRSTTQARDQDSSYITRITSQLPSGLTGVTATTQGGTCSVSGSTLTCDLGILARAEQRTVSVTGTVRPDAPPVAGGLTLKVTGSTYSRELDQSNDSASVTDDVTAVADIGVTLTASPTSPPAGADITYTAVVTNRGPSNAASVAFSDPLPAGMSNPRASVPGGSCSVRPADPNTRSAQTDTVLCSLPDLAPGASATVTVLLRSAPNATGTVRNIVTTTARTPDGTPADNRATLVSTLTSLADVRTALTVPAGNVPLGGSFSYELTISNDGPSTASDVRTAFSVPPGFTVGVPSSPYCTSTRCRIPTLAPGASVVLRGTISVAATATPGPATISASAAAATPDPTGGNNTAGTVVYVGAPTLQVAVLGAITDTRRTRGADVGDQVVWTYVVTNAGDVDLTGLTVVLPDSTIAVATTCQLGALPRGATAACRSTQTQPVTPADVRALAVTTTVQVTASWAGGSEVRSPSGGGSLTTVLPQTVVVPSSDAMLVPASSTTAAPAAQQPYLSGP